ncbi:hypothetical protein G6F43_003464 [Rhizopus delemar]|nr:hypothetical protein G6F43_003464 [Rhizopus delemar]
MTDQEHDKDIWAESGEEDNVYERKLAEREWDRLQEDHGNTGYKIGIVEGKEVNMQKGFDEGYKDGLSIGKAVGKLRGVVGTRIVFYEQLLKNEEAANELRALFNEIDNVEVNHIYSVDYFRKDGPKDKENYISPKDFFVFYLYEIINELSSKDYGDALFGFFMFFRLLARSATTTATFRSRLSPLDLPVKQRISTKVIDDVRGIMRKVPQPVVVVTTSKPEDPNYRRGITVASFTSVCLNPEPLVSFCVRVPSRASQLLHSSGSMVVNMLSHEQVQQSTAFSSPDADQFKDVPFFDDPITGLPVLMGTVGAMHCEVFKVVQLGDHEMWIIKVLKVEEGVGGEHGLREESKPLLYYDRGYRSVGDQVFMKAFTENDGTLNTTKWTHRAHLRMAWNYIRELGPDAAGPVIKQTIQSHFKKDTRKSQAYNETITSFYIALVSAAVRSFKDYENDFFALVERYPELLDPKTIETYYSPERLRTEKAKHEFVEPDLRPLPKKL